MLYRAREDQYSEGGLNEDTASSDDPLLTIAYAISEQIITILGPTFWMLLAFLFVAEELGH